DPRAIPPSYVAGQGVPLQAQVIGGRTEAHKLLGHRPSSIRLCWSGWSGVLGGQFTKGRRPWLLRPRFPRVQIPPSWAPSTIQAWLLDRNMTATTVMYATTEALSLTLNRHACKVVGTRQRGKGNANHGHSGHHHPRGVPGLEGPDERRGDLERQRRPGRGGPEQRSRRGDPGRASVTASGPGGTSPRGPTAGS